MKKIAINGLGRIGRLVLRQNLSSPLKDLQIVAANDLTPTDELAYLLRYDSVHERASFPIESGQDYLELGAQKLAIFNEKEINHGPVFYPTGNTQKISYTFRYLRDSAHYYRNNRYCPAGPDVIVRFHVCWLDANHRRANISISCY